jgi:hypothetical protein
MVAGPFQPSLKRRMAAMNLSNVRNMARSSTGAGWLADFQALIFG